MTDAPSLIGQTVSHYRITETPGHRITQFQSDQIPGFGWSPDGKDL
jgi:hypothetical protein